MSQADDAPSPEDLICALPHIKSCPHVRFKEVKDVQSQEFRDAMGIYSASFPDNERRPVASIKEMLNCDRITLITGRLESETVFMALLYPLKGTSFLLGDYLATAERHRGKGIGRAFLRSIFDSMKGMQLNYFLIQIENPHLDRDETKMRRLKFYRGLGMKRLLGVRYILPPLQGTKPTELVLMAFSREDDDRLAAETVRRVVVQMFDELYGRHEGDEFLASILGSMPDLIMLD